jgi:NAD(P)H dehydrogenase (quinone)
MVIITGATGTIGRHLVRELHEQGVTFRAVVRDMGKGRELGCDLVLGDLSRPDSLPTAFRGAETLFLNSSASPEMAAQQKGAIAAAKQAGVQRIVKVSALGAQRGSKMALGRWHAEVEQALRDSGLGWTILQPTSFMQNFLGNAASIKAEGALYGSFGSGRVPFVDAADIAAVGVAVLGGSGHESKTHVLTGGEPLALAEVAERIGGAIGKPVRYVDVPVEAAVQGMTGAGMPEWLARDLGELMAFFATGAGAAVSPAVEQVTGRKPRTFADFLVDNAGAFRA